MLNVLTKIRTFHQPFTGKLSKLQILLIERVLRLIERDYTHWKGLVVLTCDKEGLGGLLQENVEAEVL